jgi:hypothetical protein
MSFPGEFPSHFMDLETREEDEVGENENESR